MNTVNTIPNEADKAGEIDKVSENSDVNNKSLTSAASGSEQIQEFPHCFITGTDTDAGKTVATSSILRYLNRHGIRSVGLKPIASGFEYCEVAGGSVNADIESLKLASNVELLPNLINQYAFQPPIAPHIAEQNQGVDIDFECITEAVGCASLEASTVLVEGVGGWRVPLEPVINSPLKGASMQKSIASLAKHLNLPVILVVGMRLGCLNHALLTAQAILGDGLHLLGWVANFVDSDFACQEENLASLKQLIPAPLLFEIPHLAERGELGSFTPSSMDVSGLF